MNTLTDENISPKFWGFRPGYGEEQETLSFAGMERDKAKAMQRPRVRLLPRLASLLLQYSELIGFVCYVAGLITVLLLPVLAKPTYISENALMPGSANPVFGTRGARDASRMADEVQELVSQSSDGYMAVRGWAVKRMSALGGDCYLHPFSPPDSPMTSIGFFSSPQHIWKSSWKNTTGTSPGVNVVGIVRAPRAAGNEAVVLVTPFSVQQKLSTGDRLALGFGMALFELWSKAHWLARDVVWILADSRYGSHTAVAAWLQEYHEPRFDLPRDWGISDLDTQSWLCKSGLYGGTLLEFKRAGIISTGLVFDITSGERGQADFIKVSGEGPNGQMPNLDLINVVNTLAMWRQGLHMRLDVLVGLQDLAWVKFLGRILEKSGQWAGKISSNWGFTMSPSSYAEGLATLFASIANQAVGGPSGAHGAFRDYQIDAVSLHMMAGGDLEHSKYHVDLLTKFGRLVEGVMRSVNNLLEKFHQSFFLYLLSGPSKYISVGVYMIPLGLLLITLPLGAAALCSESGKADKIRNSTDASQSSSTGLLAEKLEKTREENLPEETKLNNSTSNGSTLNREDTLVLDLRSTKTDAGRWRRAVVVVGIVQLWASIVALLPPLVSRLVDGLEMKMEMVAGIAFYSAISPLSLKMVGWAALSLVSLLTAVTFLPTLQAGDWMAVKALVSGMATIGLVVMSQIDFAVSLVGAVVLVPMCLCACPLPNVWRETQQGKRSIWVQISSFVGTVVNILGSPPILLASAAYYLGDSWQVLLENLWHWTELLWAWGSALYIYVVVVHLPCSILCVYILFLVDETRH